MASLASGRISIWLSLAALALGQHCYYGPGAKFQAPDDLNLVPCLNSEFASCCFAGDICLAGGACYNIQKDDTYQYGCTDIDYKDASCPFKCGWSPDHSPWVALEICENEGIENTWVCHSPESCGCEWRSSYQLLKLPPRGCKEMGSLARVAIYGPPTLEAYASLPKKPGGSTGYFSKSVTTVVPGYTPDSIGPTTTYSMPSTVVQLNKNGIPSPSFGSALLSGSLPPIPTTGVLAESSSFPPEILAGSTSGLTNSGGNSSPTGSNSGAKSSSTGGSGSGSNGGGSSGGGGGGGLTTGAKVGLGVGIAGGVCLLAAIILTAVVLRKRKQQPKGAGQDPDYMQGYNEKSHKSYQSYTSAPSAAYYDPHHRDSPSPGLYEAPQTQEEEEAVKKRTSPQGPQELGGSQVHEMESNASTPALSPVVGSHSRSGSGVK